MEHEKQEIKPGFKLGITWGNLPEDMYWRDIFQTAYVNHQILESSPAVQTLRREDNQDNMTHSEKEGLKKLPEATGSPKFCGVGEYDHMELINYIDGLFIDDPTIPDY
ncbi:hypothetical protein O181_002604 [Austropuccinia psidii MF-1]|uniref:Uncharacterized protein n=1 Tax=Austropuccinia psidii MF-1 TaxID=1389203 RepID=A0A9Q3BCR1_9BASI|nr:hypothetical protein [Austropuccinia psidii MF-1]